VVLPKEITILYTYPEFVSCDNGPNSASGPAALVKRIGNTTTYIEPGSSSEKGYAESITRRISDVFLNTALFVTVAEIQGLANRWLWEFNNLVSYSDLQGVRPWR